MCYNCQYAHDRLLMMATAISRYLKAKGEYSATRYTDGNARARMNKYSAIMKSLSTEVHGEQKQKQANLFEEK